jgi:hypothetical protein
MKHYFSETILRKNDKGIYLIELMIIVILISVVATAFLRFHSEQSDTMLSDSTFAISHKYIRAALDEIGFHLRFARPRFPDSPDKPLLIRNEASSDWIRILHNGIAYEYFVNDKAQLVRRMNNTEDILVENVNSFKALQMGTQTVVLTISVKTPNDITDYPPPETQSFSEVIISNSIL